MDSRWIYKCLMDDQRVRILHLLREGPLSVSQLQLILVEGQVKISKQLAYMKRCGLLKSSKDGARIFYRLVDPIPPLLEANLDGLQNLTQFSSFFAADLKSRNELLQRLESEGIQHRAPFEKKSLIRRTEEALQSPNETNELDDHWGDFPL